MGAPAPLGDMLALKIQQLRPERGKPRPLLRIDNRAQAGAAPFQFDTVQARLHRHGCRAIPRGSKTALYGLWQIPSQARAWACPVCRPESDGDSDVANEAASDYIYGLLSVLDQFGGVIRERGREFRESEEGRQLKAGLDGIYRNLEDWERATVKAVLNSLEDVLATIVEIDESLDSEPSNGSRHNGLGDHNGGGP